jgi:hypothetical protein
MLRALVQAAFFVYICVAAAGCGRSGDAARSTKVGGGASDLGTADDLAAAPEDLAGLAGADLTIPCGPLGCVAGLSCVGGQCCAGLVCVPPMLPSPPDLAPPPDLAGITVDLGGPIASGCTRDTECAPEVCDWLSGRCVPVAVCARDRDCAFGAACVADQCLPIQACLPIPIPILPPCATGDRCQFPPGVCVPQSNCAGNADCAGGVCTAGYCQPSSCAGARDCNDGYACVGGGCTPRRYCGPFEPCPRGQHCHAHVCS